MTRTKLKIAVISDIHAASAAREHSKETNIIVPAPLNRANPLDDLKSWIKRNPDVTVDYIVCPGDITNQADADAFKWMWDQIDDLAKLLHAREVHATCGNHDLDSRYLMKQKDDDPDAKGALLSLSSRFPAISEDDHNHFWAQNYVILERTQPLPHRILLLNTCAYHGGDPEEIRNGRISSRTIKSILARLSGATRHGLNVVVCHHHLAPLPSWGTIPDYEYARKGNELVQGLEEANVGPWLVIHGHRHWPDCVYAMGGASSPVVFCAGSFGKSEALVSNQFHIIEVEIDSKASRPRGTVQTWVWTLPTGWQPSEPAEKVKALTFRSGFGFGGSLSVLVDQINEHLTSAGTYLEWNHLVEKVPDLKNLLPRDFAVLRRDLKPLRIRIHVEDGEPIEIARRGGL